LAPSLFNPEGAMTDMLRRTGMLELSITRLLPAALAGMLAMVVAADTAFAESLRHIKTEIEIKKHPKVRADSVPGHPDKIIFRTPQKPPPASTTGIKREPNPDEPGYVEPVSRGTKHRYGDTVCHDGTCVSE
jgi:hypothetical protein